MTRCVAVALALGLVTGCIQFDDLFFAPDRVDAYSFTYDVVPSYLVEEVVFETEDGMHLYGVWAHQEAPSPTILVFHGNSENLDACWGRVEYYWNWGGHEVLCFDYRGYGKSEGEPDHDGVLEIDGKAAADYVAATSFYPDDQLWIGLSLGGAVAIHTADEVAPRALVIEGTYASADDIIDDSLNLDLPAGWFFQDPFDNLEAIASIQAPVLIIHGLEDDLIDPQSGQRLYDAAPNPRELWQPHGVGHSDIIGVMPADYRARVNEWYDAWATPGAP